MQFVCPFIKTQKVIFDFILAIKYDFSSFLAQLLLSICKTENPIKLYLLIIR